MDLKKTIIIAASGLLLTSFAVYAADGVGIYVNTESFPEELSDKATSMYLETGKYTDRNRLIAGVLENFEQYYEKFVRTCDLGDMLEDYNRLLANRDRPVRILDRQNPFEGTALGISSKGGLLVRTETGEIREVRGGEVSVRGLYSYV